MCWSSILIALRPGIDWPPASAVVARDHELAGTGVTTVFAALRNGSLFRDDARGRAGLICVCFPGHVPMLQSVWVRGTYVSWGSLSSDASHCDGLDLRNLGFASHRMIERLWRSLKYACVYLRAVETGSQARGGIGKRLAYYNAERPHSTHGILTLYEVHANQTEPMRMAA